MSLSQTFNGTQVFIALRPNIFPNVEREHLTLEYLGAFPTVGEIIDKCSMWRKYFSDKPVKVEVCGGAQWRATNGKSAPNYYEVALIEFPDFPQLSYQKNWHITLRKQERPFVLLGIDPQDYGRNDICQTLWIGYKDENMQNCWMPYNGIFSRKAPVK